MTTDHFKPALRNLVEADRRVLRHAIWRQRWKLGRIKRRTFGFGFAIFAVPLALGVAVSKSVPTPLPVACWFLLCGTLATRIYLGERKRTLAEIQRRENALRFNQAREFKIQSAELVEFEELDDEGPCYPFQIENGSVLFIRGQAYSSSARFPNTDFSLVDIRDANGVCLEEVIHKRGQKLKPIRTISAKQKSAMMIPDHMSTIDGRLADIETLLVARNSH